MVVTAVDTNVLVTLLQADQKDDVSTAQIALENTRQRGSLVISPVVYAELLAAPRMSEEFLESFLDETGLKIIWALPRVVWQDAASAFKVYATRRCKDKKDTGPRRILADFLIGAHAMHHATQFLTFDAKVYQQAFPELDVITLIAT